MKTLLTSLLVAGLLLLSEPQSRAPEPQPEFVTCVMTWICLGLFACCVVACYYHAWSGEYSGPTNSPPLMPPQDPEDPVPTNSVPTNIPPQITLNAYEQTQRLDVSTSNWLDRAGSPVSAMYRTVLQTSTSPAGPFTNGYVVTLWESAYGNTMLVEDGSGNGLMTNYTPRAANGSVTNYAPLALEHREPSRFWRAKP